MGFWTWVRLPSTPYLTKKKETEKSVSFLKLICISFFQWYYLPYVFVKMETEIVNIVSKEEF